ncbi:thioesterase II family protein [Baaleninema simplex]|uniref:thioesterase II family protein n=1 Tax=Baaleninema simplex TaxID=2862350 RepID=UPI00034D0770|nr:alpha/beta fold hydrolase [Baaleninema simplex]
MKIETPWIPQFNSNNADELRLFCFPYAGGGTLSFRGWRDRFPSNIGVYPIELPGRGFRLQEPLLTNLSSIVEAIAPVIYPYLDKPFAFFGHSMGALIAFELTRLLRKNYRIKPLRLCVSGRCAPQTPPIVPPIHQLPEPEFIEALRRLNGTPNEVFQNSELLALVLPILRADFSVVETYSYRPEDPLSCPISIFGGLNDPETTIDFLEAWKIQTNHQTSFYMLSGDHFFIHSNFDEFSSYLCQDLKNSARIDGCISIS